MGLESEDNLGDLGLPELDAKTVKIADIQVMIFSLGKMNIGPTIGTQEMFTFGFCYPFRYEDGGMISVYNPTIWVGAKNQIFASKELLYRAFAQLRIKTFKKNPDIILIWDGKINRDQLPIRRGYGTE